MDFQSLVNFVLAAVTVGLFLYAMRKRDTLPADSRLLEMIDRLQIELTGVKDELRVTQGELRTTQGELRNVQTYAERLAMQVIRLGGEPVTMADIEDTTTGTIHTMSRDTKRMLMMLREEFSIDELDVIAFEIGIRRGELGEGDIDSKALRLMEKAKAQGKIVDLAAIIWRERPDTARK